MFVYILIIVSVVFFVLGIVFIVKGWGGSANSDKAVVPINDLEEIKEFKENYSASKLKVEPEPTTVQKIGNVKSLSNFLVNENLKQAQPPKGQPEKNPQSGPVEKAKGVSDSEQIKKLNDQMAILQSQSEEQSRRYEGLEEKHQQQCGQFENEIEKLKEEKQKLSDALQRELSSKEIKTLAAEEKNQWIEKEKQLNQALQSIKELTETNHALQKQMESQSARLQETELKIKETNDERQHVEMEWQARVASLQHSINQNFSERGLWENERREFQKLKSEYDKIISEKNQISKTIEEANESYEEKIKSIQSRVESLRAENQNELRKQSESFSAQMAESAAIVEALTCEKEEWLKLKAELESHVGKFNRTSTQMQEKEKLLHYELTKSRAQIFGLEKICKDFKTQIEEQAKLVRD